MVFFLGAVLVLAFLEGRGRGQPEGRLGTAYVVAAALSILILSKTPYGEIGWLSLMKGEIITISNFDLLLTAAVLALFLAGLAMFHKELLLVFSIGSSRSLFEKMWFFGILCSV
jgi:ABC-type Mn2+/Zn2+ transport system permease subunit